MTAYRIEPFQIDEDTYTPGDRVVVAYRRDDLNLEVRGHFAGTVDVGLLGVGIVVTDEDGEDEVVTAPELRSIETVDARIARQLAEMQAWTR